MQRIADWLEKLDLGQYAQRFAENDRHLTDADLEKIGVSLGHRRKILAVIAELPDASPSKHDLNGRLEKRRSYGLFDHLAVSRQLELEHGTFRYVR